MLSPGISTKAPCGPEGFSVLPLPHRGVMTEVGPQGPGAHSQACRPLVPDQGVPAAPGPQPSPFSPPCPFTTEPYKGLAVRQHPEGLYKGTNQVTALA